MTTKKNTARIITWLAAIVTGVIVIILPLVYFLLSYQNMAGGIEAEAEINARIVTQIISTHPDIWEYEELRLMEYLSRSYAYCKELDPRSLLGW